MHKRREIIAELRQRLTALPKFHWVRNQRVPLDGQTGRKYPGITFFVENETTRTETIHVMPRPQDRVLTVTVQVWMQTDSADQEKIESDLDDYAQLVETAFSLALSLVDVTNVQLLSTEMIVGEDDPRLHVAALTYQIDYSTHE